MSITNSKLLSTILGDFNGWYIRIEWRIQLDGSALISFQGYPSKLSYVGGASHINNSIDLDLGSFKTPILASNDMGATNIHNLAIVELSSRDGFDLADLSITDLV